MKEENQDRGRGPHEWMKQEPPEYLPPFLRDFHDAKDFFKCLQQTYGDKFPLDLAGHNWVSNHIFTVDFFLWFCGIHGYTLQKTRKKGIAFWSMRETVETARAKRSKAFAVALQSKDTVTSKLPPVQQGGER